ncbi:Creatinase/aminopeptidase [Meredithblackwellia eburnea MCA 4105]
MAPAKTETPVQEGPLAPAILDKYKEAGKIVDSVLTKVKAKAVEGAKLIELCEESDKLIEEAAAAVYNKVKGVPKGIAFPTSLSLNNILQNYSPLPSDTVAAAQTLAKDDVLKIVLGAHIDGYAVVTGETIIVSPSASPVEAVRADLLAAAHHAAEAALRSVKAGARNWELTDAIKSVLKEYEASGVKGVEGILSHQLEQNSIEAKKGIIAFPSGQQRNDGDNNFTLEEGEVYGLNIIVTNGEKNFKADESRTTIFQKTTSTYSLKMKASRATFSEISKKAGAFPFTLRVLEEESKARFGVRECTQHGLLKQFDVATTDRPTDLSAQVFVTFNVTKTGAVRLSPTPTFFTAEGKVKSAVEIKDEELKALLAKPLKAKPAKKKKAANGEAEKEEEKKE